MLTNCAEGTVVLTNWKKADNMKILEKAGSNKLRGYLLDVFPDRILAPMKVNRSLRTRTTQHIMTQLYEHHGILTRQDLEYLMAQIKNKCPADLAPDAFIADWQTSLEDLAQAGQRIPKLMATDILQNCFGRE